MDLHCKSAMREEVEYIKVQDGGEYNIMAAREKPGPKHTASSDRRHVRSERDAHPWSPSLVARHLCVRLLFSPTQSPTTARLSLTPAEVIYLPQLTRTHPLLSTRQRVECTRYGLYIRRKVQARGGDRNGWLWFVFPFQSHIPLYFLSN